MTCRGALRLPAPPDCRTPASLTTHKGGMTVFLHVRGMVAVSATSLMVAASLASCGGSQAGAKTRSFSAAILEPSSLLPANYSEIYGAQVVTALFTPLVTFDIKTNQTHL